MVRGGDSTTPIGQMGKLRLRKGMRRAQLVL